MRGATKPLSKTILKSRASFMRVVSGLFGRVLTSVFEILVGACSFRVGRVGIKVHTVVFERQRERTCKDRVV